MQKRYAQIQNGQVVNIILATEEFMEIYRETDDAKRFDEIVLIEEDVHIGWGWDGSKFVDPNPPILEPEVTDEH